MLFIGSSLFKLGTCRKSFSQCCSQYVIRDTLAYASRHITLTKFNVAFERKISSLGQTVRSREKARASQPSNALRRVARIRGPACRVKSSFSLDTGWYHRDRIMEMSQTYGGPSSSVARVLSRA